jgi:phage I-like protein
MHLSSFKRGDIIHASWGIMALLEADAAAAFISTESAAAEGPLDAFPEGKVHLRRARSKKVTVWYIDHISSCAAAVFTSCVSS